MATEDIVGQIAALIEDVPDAPNVRDTDPPSETEIQFLRRKMDKCSVMLEEYFHRLPVINPNRLGPGNPGYGMAQINSILGNLIDHLALYTGKADDQI
jgi:hypothetical protein